MQADNKIIMSFGDVIVMPIEVVKDLYGDRGDHMRGPARAFCRTQDARQFLKNYPVDPANSLLCAIRNELESPAKPLIPTPLPIVQAIRRFAEPPNVEIVIKTDTSIEHWELRFCPNRPQDGAYTNYSVPIHHPARTGHTVEVIDVLPLEGATSLSVLSQSQVLAEHTAEDRELLLSKLAPYRFRFGVVTSAIGRQLKVWLVGINQFSHDELADGILPVSEGE